MITPELFFQASAILVCAASSFFLSATIKRSYHPRSGHIQRFLNSIFPLLLFFTLLQTLSIPLFQFYFHKPTSLIITSLLFSLAITGSLIFSKFVKNPFLRTCTHITIWALVVFYNIGVLSPLLSFLGSSSLKFGSNTISLLAIIKAFTTTTFLVWSAIAFSHYLESRLKQQKHIQPSVHILISKISKTFFVSLSILLGLSLFGIDLSAFSFLAGAVGVGIAFGLQNILSNFFCGFILLADKSIKPGDVLCIRNGGIYGVVHKLHARYVSLRTREGKEHLIPNQLIISEKLENWSFSDPNIRAEIAFRVSYDSDLTLVKNILLEIAKEIPRILVQPATSVRFVSLIDNAVELKLRFWIGDPEKGIGEIRSDVIYKAWKEFRARGIKVPLPPRELHTTTQQSNSVEKLLKKEN